MSEIFLWLDDIRVPPSHADTGIVWTWAKTYEQAIKELSTGNVIFASLDHDLAHEHYVEFQMAQLEQRPFNSADCKELTGYEVLNWIEEHDMWPELGIRIHTMNTVRLPIMLEIVYNKYGKNFGLPYKT